MLSKVKSKILAKGYVRNNFNATKTIKEFEPDIKPKTAEVKATRMLRSEGFNKSLEEVMNEKGLNDELVTNIHERNLKQNRSIPASNEAINIYHKIKGNYAPEKKAVLNININDPEVVNRRIKDLEQELILLQAQK